jgi:hypothetical protein
VTQIVELRKNLRPAGTTPEAEPPRPPQLPSTHASPYVLKVLGLAAVDTLPGEALTAD